MPDEKKSFQAAQKADKADAPKPEPKAEAKAEVKAEAAKPSRVVMEITHGSYGKSQPGDLVEVSEAEAASLESLKVAKRV